MQTKQLIKTLAKESTELDPQTKKIILQALDGKREKPKLLSTKDAAEFLSIHPATLREYATNKIIEPIKISKRKFWWNQQDLERLMLEGPNHEN